MKEFITLIFILNTVAVSAQQPGDYDRDFDGKLDRYELNQFREDGGDVRDLRGGLYLEPEVTQPYVIDLFPEDGEKVEY